MPAELQALFRKCPNPGSDEVVGLFPVTKSGGPMYGTGATPCGYDGGWKSMPFDKYAGDSGSAARFFKCCPMDDPDAEVKRLFYCAKASKADRDEGCEGLEERERDSTSGNNRKAQRINGGDEWEYLDVPAKPHRNTCPCVKPTALMRYLCRLVTPPGGVVLDPFMGSGSTGKAAVLEGFRFIGIERDRESFEIAKARLLAAIEERRRAVGAVGQGMLPLVGERESYG